MRFALLPAAGKSRRMGRPKLALPLGGRTILEHVIAALLRAEVEHVLVVVGPHAPELASLARTAGASVCPLAEETAHMRETVEHGLNWLERQHRPRPDDDWLLVPADHPTLTPDIVRQLGAARRAHPDASILVPTWQGRRGHPLLLSWGNVAAIRAYPRDRGLNAYVRERVAETVEIPASSEDVLGDLDTPEQYEFLRRRWGEG